MVLVSASSICPDVTAGSNVTAFSALLFSINPDEYSTSVLVTDTWKSSKILPSSSILWLLPSCSISSSKCVITSSCTVWYMVLVSASSICPDVTAGS
ncbi:hypothetical protein GN956_G27180, partial [Arapaima gigas]